MKRLLFIILSCALLLTGCGDKASKDSNADVNSISDSEKEIVYEDIKIQDIIIPKKAKIELLEEYGDEFLVVDRSYVIQISATKVNSEYDEASIESYLQSISFILDVDYDNHSVIDVKLTDDTSSPFTIYTASYDSKSEYYGYLYYNGYMYIAELCGICDSNDWTLITLKSITDTSPYFEDFKNMLKVIQIPANISDDNKKELESGDNQSPTGDWEIKYFVDKFGDNDPNSQYIGSKTLRGTFSNSATTDSLVYARMILTDELAFKLFEYGQNEVTNSYSSDCEYNITFKYENGGTIDYKGTMYSYGDRIFLEAAAGSTLVRHLKDGEVVKIYIEESDRPICNYLFSVDGTGFKEVYDEYNK